MCEFLQKLYFHYSLINSSEQGHVVRLAQTRFPMFQVVLINSIANTAVFDIRVSDKNTTAAGEEGGGGRSSLSSYATCSFCLHVSS